MEKQSRFNDFYSLFIGVLIGVLISIIGISYFDVLKINIRNQLDNYENNYTVNVDSVISEAIEETSDAVVGIRNIQGNTVVGTGSGVIYKKDNDEIYIITNNHVVSGGTTYNVVFEDGHSINASFVAGDQYTDLAILKAEVDFDVVVAEFADSDVLKVGEFVIAIGNPLGEEFFGTATLGIISGTERFVEVDLNKDGTNDWVATVLQHDAAINPGNSGGALVNVDGKIIGINSMKIVEEEIEGIGFAIPSNTVQNVIADLEMYGEVQRPLLGIGVSNKDIADMTREEKIDNSVPTDLNHGILITSISENGVADRVNLREGDILTDYNDNKIYNLMSFRVQLYDSEIGDEIEIRFIRNNQQYTVNITLE